MLVMQELRRPGRAGSAWLEAIRPDQVRHCSAALRSARCVRIWALSVRLHNLDGTVSFRLDIAWWLTHGDTRPKGAETVPNRQGQGEALGLAREVRYQLESEAWHSLAPLPCLRLLTTEKALSLFRVAKDSRRFVLECDWETTLSAFRQPPLLARPVAPGPSPLPQVVGR